MSSRLGRAVLRGGLIAVVIGLLLAVPMTFLDWRLNPGQLFRGPSGTIWSVVLQTAWSWFWPTASLAAAGMALVVAVHTLRRTT